MAGEMKIFVQIKIASITKLYDPKMKAKIETEITKSAKKAIDKNAKLTSSKPKGWTAGKDKGFILDIQFMSLTKTEKNSELHFKASVALSMSSTTSKMMGKAKSTGSATAKVSVTQKNPDAEALYIAGYAVADQIKKYAVKIMLKSN